MIDEDKLKSKIEGLKSNLIHGACSSQIAMETCCKEEAYNEVLAILDAMQEEPNDDWKYSIAEKLGVSREEFDKIGYNKDYGKEEPVSKDYRERYKHIAQSEAFKKTHEGMSIGEVIPIEGEINIPQVFDEGYWERLGEEPVSKDLVSAAHQAWLKEVDREYHSDFFTDGFKAGAKWQRQKDEHLIWQLSSANYDKGIEEGKKQMMKNAVEAEVQWHDGFLLMYDEHEVEDLLLPDIKVGDKVRLAVIKED